MGGVSGVRSQGSGKSPSESSDGWAGKPDHAGSPAIDRTVKLYIGGKQARPDSGYSMEVRAADGRLLGEAPLGNRKDIRNAVEAARKAAGWAKATAHNAGPGALLLRGEFFAAAR